jgi:hypothetical protein
LTFIYPNLDSGVAMHKKGLCKKASSCGTNRKTCYHISGRSVFRALFCISLVLKVISFNRVAVLICSVAIFVDFFEFVK